MIGSIRCEVAIRIVKAPSIGVKPVQLGSREWASDAVFFSRRASAGTGQLLQIRSSYASEGVISPRT